MGGGMNAPALIDTASALPLTQRGRIHKRAASKAQTREKVIAAARFMFTEVGYFDTTIRDLAQRIGMSTGAVFSTVPDKETLWTEAVGGPPPSQPLAEEVALLLAQLPGWRFLFKHDGSAWYAQLNSPCYSPERGTGQIYLAPNAASPAAALRKVRLDCLAFNAAHHGRGH